MMNPGTTVSALILTALLVQVCPAQRVLSEAQPIPPTTSRPIEVPPFNYFGDSQCDGDGNLYFHSGSFTSGQIFELSKDGSAGKFLQPTGKFADPAVAEFDSFWVSEDGEVSILAHGDGSAFVIPFDRSGAMKDPFPLQVPEHVLLTDLAVFDNGSMFVSGHYGEKGTGHRQGQSYQAIFAPSGKLARALSVAGPDADFSKSKPTDGGVASARGNLYFLGSDRITVISSAGEVVRRVPFKKPDQGAVATKIYPSHGTVAVELNVKDKSSDLYWRRLLVIDESTENVVGYYQPPGPNWSDVCLTRDQELVFLIVDNNKQSMATVRIW